MVPASPPAAPALELTVVDLKLTAAPADVMILAPLFALAPSFAITPVRPPAFADPSIVTVLLKLRFCFILITALSLSLPARPPAFPAAAVTVTLLKLRVVSMSSSVPFSITPTTPPALPATDVILTLFSVEPFGYV